MLVLVLSGFAYPVHAQDGLSGNASAAAGQSRPGNTTDYNLLLIFIIIAALYICTYVLSVQKIILAAVHRKIWNLILLLSTLSMLILGLLLTLREDYHLNIQLPFDMKFWHVEAGIIMGVIAVFHICWHWRYFAKLFKPVNQSGQ